MAHFDIGDAIKLFAAVLGILLPILKRALSEKAEAPPPKPVVVPRPRPAFSPPAPDRVREKLAETFAALERDAKALAESVRQDRATERFFPVLDDWLPRRCREARDRAMAGDASLEVIRWLMDTARWLTTVRDEVRALIDQRRDPTLLAELGDADALAECCYAPIVDFARTRGLPLRSARPVARLSDFDLSIWTGFAPTSLAPIFLPPDFFSRVAWWPAVAHEIGHDFLISIDRLRDRLGVDLGLPPEDVGTLPLHINAEGLPSGELVRVHGAWLEELFCDVFGTLMCGPAYALTMVELFSHEQDPREVLLVPFDRRTGHYDTHPPRHLRVHAAAWVLEAAGFHQDAREILEEWSALNDLGDDPSHVPLLFFTSGRWVQVPFGPVAAFTRDFVERLYAGPLPALGGIGLRDISGLDFGPHEHAEANRARLALLAGQVPQTKDARAVIAGAVLAAREQPEQEATILHRARQAIVAVGTFEHRPDVYVPAALPQVPEALELSPDAVREALVLSEILRRPGSTGRHRRVA
ncbi:MAG: hypothetical protein IRZ16_11220 [Myxococcaceae bacterium]|nr:hypothetical protein [Myxococcaceae bacterium]